MAGLLERERELGAIVLALGGPPSPRLAIR